MENKERIGNEVRPIPSKEPVMRDLREDEVLPREVEHWMERLEKPAAAVNDPKGKPILTPSGPVNIKIKANTTRSKFSSGFRKKVDDVGLWLSTFVFRLIKKNKDKLVEFEGE